MCQGGKGERVGDQSNRYRNLIPNDITTDASIVFIFEIKIEAGSNPSLDTQIADMVYERL